MHQVTGGGRIGRRRRAREGTALRRNRVILLVLVLGFVLQACGTRLPDSAFVRAQRGSNVSDQTAAGEPGDVTDAGTAGTEGDQGTAGSTGQTPGSAGATGGRTAGNVAGQTGGGPGGPN